MEARINLRFTHRPDAAGVTDFPASGSIALIGSWIATKFIAFRRGLGSSQASRQSEEGVGELHLND